MKSEKFPIRGRQSLTFGVVFILIFSIIFIGCARWSPLRRINPPPKAQEVEGVRRVGIDPPPEYEYRIDVGDAISVRFFYYPDMLEPKITVPDDGIVQMPLIGGIQVSGLTEAELNSLLREKYSQHLMYPEVVARIVSKEHGAVYLDGAGTGGGIIPYQYKLSLLSVLKHGNLGEKGAMHSIIVMRNLSSKEYKAFRIDARKILDGKENDIYLEPNDIVYVPTKFISDVNYFVAAYIDRVLGTHVSPVHVFPDPFPYKGSFNYNVTVGMEPPAGQ